MYHFLIHYISIFAGSIIYIYTAMTKTIKCIHIAKLLKNHASMTREEINLEMEKRWPEDPPLSRSTFARYKNHIEELLPCEICFSQVTKRYSIRWLENHVDEQLISYLLSMYDIEESASLLLKHKRCIYHVDFATGSEKLPIILQAIDKRLGIQADYCSFMNSTRKSRIFIPVFLTTWEGRWYCIAEVTTHPGDHPRVYALERMANISLTSKHYVPQYTGSRDEYFRNSYGIQAASEDHQALDIVIKANKIQSDYLRKKPLHSSQMEIKNSEEEGETYVYFKLHLYPCYNFYQQLLWQRENIEVISPQSVREEMLHIAQSILDKYK